VSNLNQGIRRQIKAIRYRLDGPWIIFPHTPTRVLRPTQPPVQWVINLFLRVKQRGVTLTTHPPHPPYLGAEVKENIVPPPQWWLYFI